MTLQFGTDGVRGVANRELTPEAMVALGRAVAQVLGANQTFLIGRDTRQSGTMIEMALSSGICSEGANVESAGPIPTPGLAFLAEVNNVPALMISASHNPYTDNGVKVLAAGGVKLSDVQETNIERRFHEILEKGTSATVPEGREVGKASRVAGGVDRYIVQRMQAIEGRDLAGLKVVIDCANGAQYGSAPRTLQELKAEVEVIHATPDGLNINEQCGSLYPADLQKAVVASKANAGLAFDGDGDRVIAVDEQGNAIDGDHILALLAFDLLQRNLLAKNGVVITLMANLGLRRAFDKQGVQYVETPVGDRYVCAAMVENGFVLGGEQSGHIIFSELATTGDGLLTGILLLDVMKRSGKTLSELASVVEKIPQELINVSVSDTVKIAESEAVSSVTTEVTKTLGNRGRVLVRPSGTEPFVRVMVEAESADEAAKAAQQIVDAVRAADEAAT